MRTSKKIPCSKLLILGGLYHSKPETLNIQRTWLNRRMTFISCMLPPCLLWTNGKCIHIKGNNSSSWPNLFLFSFNAVALVYCFDVSISFIICIFMRKKMSSCKYLDDLTESMNKLTSHSNIMVFTVFTCEEINISSVKIFNNGPLLFYLKRLCGKRILYMCLISNYYSSKKKKKKSFHILQQSQRANPLIATIQNLTEQIPYFQICCIL